jgi:diguanylate cyclase (GGDEF)-like protein/PAS domain S-box-containing protein
MTSIERMPKKLFFLSLKWKVVLGISLVLIVVNLAVTVVTYKQILLQFDQNRIQTQQTYEREFEGLVRNSFDRMRQLSYIIPLLKIKTEYLTELFQQQLQQIIKEHISLLQIEYGLNSLYYFQETEQAAVVWNGSPLPDAVKKMLRKSIISEQPQNLLECQAECNLYTMTPLLHDNGETGIILLVVSLRDLFVEFASISDADIGLISRINSFSNTADESIILKKWNAMLLAVSHAEQQRVLMEQFSQQYSLAQSINNSQQITWLNKTYEVQLFPLNRVGDKENTMTLVISDISQELEAINIMTLKTFNTGLLGLLISELLLFAILWLPMRKITHIVKVLPLFAQNSYASIREQLKFSHKKLLFDDEIGVLSSSVIDLSQQLEGLQTQIEQKTEGLVLRSNELAKEKEFISGLLEATQAIILTQDKDGKIKSLNSKGLSLITNESGDVIGTLFDDILINNDLKREVVEKLNEIRHGEKEHFQHEAEIHCPKVPSCSVSWYHSLLSIHGDDGTIMLSVGLDITERKMAQEKMEWDANHDYLTRLVNRRRFQIEMERILSIACQYEKSGALLYFDVDHFKYLNDSQGHQAGDKMLQLISKKLESIIKRPDLIARLGGDEFAIVIEDADETVAKKVAQRIIENVRSIETGILGGTHKISVSIGIVIFPDEGFNFPDLMANADLAMYQAKEKKRGTYHLFSSDDKGREHANQLMQRKERIERAIAEDRFILYFQPILNIKTGEIKRYETLIRMKETDGTIQAPDFFIPEAEQLGLIDEIDQLVMKKAIKALGGFVKEGLDLSLSVNLSGKAMDNPEISVLIQSLLKEYEVEPSRLIIEVTETAAVSDIVGAERLMHEIKDLGCRFALDDFGVGFSSFFYLKQLPVDYVKLDGMFIRQLPYSAEDQVFVKALNEMAHGLRKQTVAEFVESQEILDMLIKYDVDYAQGYFIGKPMPDILR